MFDVKATDATGLGQEAERSFTRADAFSGLHGADSGRISHAEAAEEGRAAAAFPSTQQR